MNIRRPPVRGPGRGGSEMKTVYAYEINRNGIRTSSEVVNENGAVIECSVCGKPMELTEQSENGIWWISCPAYMAGGQGADEHDSYLVNFTDPSME